MYNLDMEHLNNKERYIISKDNKMALFDENGNRVSDWYDNISTYGNIKKSEYYIVRKNDKVAIIDKYGWRISNWFDGIYAKEFILGKSDYYIGYENKGSKRREAIFDKYGTQITKWFNYIHTMGLVKGESDYYIAEINAGEISLVAVFSKDRQITCWHHNIGFDGAVTGVSEFIAAFDIMGDVYEIKIYNTKGEIVYSFSENKKGISSIVPCTRNGKFIYRTKDEIYVFDINQDIKKQIKINNFIKLGKCKKIVYYNYLTNYVGPTLKCPICKDRYYIYFVTNDGTKLCPWCSIEKIEVFTI
jgi:hypothetical protein